MPPVRWGYAALWGGREADGEGFSAGDGMEIEAGLWKRACRQPTRNVQGGKKMKKKLIALFLVLAMGFSMAAGLTGCRNVDDTGNAGGKV